MQLLVVEDNRRMAALLTRGLRQAGFSVVAVHDGAAALDALSRGLHGRAFDAVVLDWMLPGQDGVSVIEQMRRTGDETAVLMLTARDDVADRVRGLGEGADDYLVKPFAFEELEARLRALVRRTRGASADRLVIDDLEIDTRAQAVRRAGRPIELSAREYAVLECLAQRRGRVVSREEILDQVYGGEEGTSSNVVDVFIAHLRRKIDRGDARKLIHTRRGRGYQLGHHAEERAP